MKKLNIEMSYRIINHGPLLVVSSEFKKKETFTPIAWNMPVEHTPPIIAITVSKENYVNFLIKKSKQFCLNVLEIENLDLIKKLGSVSGKDTDKISEFCLKTKKCKTIAASYMLNSAAVIECVLIKTISVEGVDIFLGKTEYCSVSEKFCKTSWDAEKIRTIHHLGGGNFATIQKI
ncbi:flavin reductase family protein [Candidatus Dependentiae bacterium]|nr:flavin reductase family protein [Candidatus Dependentiae bacterium]